jgi:adhesin transport system membrane fusion protein
MLFKKLGIIHDSSVHTLKHSHIFSHIILWAMIACLIIFFIWAKYAILDEVTVGQGKVVPSSQIQVIQNLEGGIVRSINVKEGSVVEKDQVLLQLNDTLFLSKQNELQKKIDDVTIELTRIEAEISDKPLQFDEQLIKSNPSLVRAESGFYNARKNETDQMKNAINLAKKEYDLTKPLLEKGAASPVELLRLQRGVSDEESKLAAFNSRTLERYNQAKGELDSYQEELLAEQDRVRRTTIRSPVKGIVKQLKVNTIGGVVSPGMDILEIVPMNDTLLIEANVHPSDIGFIRLGQKATVKLSAYDFSIYGGLNGIVEGISADTIIDEHDKKGESFYVIRIRTQRNYLITNKKPLYIMPGMQATVDILTGEKSVLDYLLKPILKTKQAALRER